MDVSTNIKAIRAHKNIAQAEIARRLDMDPSSYHRLENRGNKLTLEQTESIAQALGVSWLELVTWGEEKGIEPIEKQSTSELEDKIKELTTTRDIAQGYSENLKRKVDAINGIFLSTILSIGEDAKLGTVHTEEETEEYALYYTTFTDKELMNIFETIYTNHLALYYVFRDLLQRDIVDVSRRESKLFLRYIDQRKKSLNNKNGNPF